MDKIIILGRGQSLERLIEFKEEIDTVILVNEFWDTPDVNMAYYKDSLIHNFIKDKKIIIIATPYCNFSKINIFIKKYNVIKIYKTQFPHTLRIGKKKNQIDILPEKLIKYYKFLAENFCYCGSLGVSILFAKYILNCNHIFIYGLDFYEFDYYLKNNHDYKNEVNKSLTIKKNWEKFYEYYSDIKLYIYTLANFKYKIK